MAETIDEEVEDSGAEVETKAPKRRKKGGLDSKLPVDLALFGSGLTTTVTGLLRRYGGRKYCTIHRCSAYVTAGLGAVHVYQHKDALLGYVRKKYRDTRELIEDFLEGEDGSPTQA